MWWITSASLFTQCLEHSVVAADTCYTVTFISYSSEGLSPNQGVFSVGELLPVKWTLDFLAEETFRKLD